jgi:lysophospholipase L1-like esterase
LQAIYPNYVLILIGTNDIQAMHGPSKGVAEIHSAHIKKRLPAVPTLQSYPDNAQVHGIGTNCDTVQQ